jgi:hypothetical protein
MKKPMTRLKPILRFASGMTVKKKASEKVISPGR